MFDIVPILLSFQQKKASVFLHGFQMTIALAILVNTYTAIGSYREYLASQSGLPEQQLVSVSSFRYSDNLQQAVDQNTDINNINRDLQALRSINGVKSVAIISSIPMGGDPVNVQSLHIEGRSDKITTPFTAYGFDENTFDTLGLELTSGRHFSQGEYNWADSILTDNVSESIIITDALAQKLFPGASAVGKRVVINKQGNTIIGVVKNMPGFHLLWDKSDYTVILPVKTHRNPKYLLSSEYETDKLYGKVEEKLLAEEIDRELTIRTLEEVKKASLDGLQGTNKLLSAVSILLLLVCTLGAYGHTVFSVSKRTEQIAIRRAFGANKQDVLMYFLLENWLIVTMGLLLGSVLAYLLNFVLGETLGIGKIAIIDLLYGVGFLWLAGILSSLYPAYRATKIPPALT